jgi:hypothetical protein
MGLIHNSYQILHHPTAVHQCLDNSREDARGGAGVGQWRETRVASTILLALLSRLPTPPTPRALLAFFGAIFDTCIK